MCVGLEREREEREKKKNESALLESFEPRLVLRRKKIETLQLSLLCAIDPYPSRFRRRAARPEKSWLRSLQSVGGGRR